MKSDRPVSADTFREIDNRDMGPVGLYQDAAIQALRRRIRQLEGSLTKYGKHLEFCSQRAWPCSCGFDEARGKK